MTGNMDKNFVVFSCKYLRNSRVNRGKQSFTHFDGFSG